MKVKKVSIPSDSLMSKITPVSYSDAFEAVVEMNSISLKEIQVEFWAGRPQWAIKLMQLRNLLVKPLGLKTDNILSKDQVRKMIEQKEKSNGLSFYGSNEHEIILYKDDKHLRFYFSTSWVLTGACRKLSASTIVQIHNKVGKIYFFFIAPFHFILVKWQFKRILRRMQKSYSRMSNKL